MKTKKYKLGRIVNHDPRSKNFAFGITNIPIVSVTHERYIPVLDQGNVGSCCGNAGIGAISTAPFINQPNKVYSRDENGALKLYSDAERIDGNGGYPPNDYGTSGLSIAKALKNAGLISQQYQHTFSLLGALQALMRGPILVGTNWHNDMFSPDPDGRVHPTGMVTGGHEYEAYRVDAELGRIWFYNSWSSAWGLNGAFYMTWQDFALLIAERGDVVVPFPITVTPPLPVVYKTMNTIQPSTEQLVAGFEGLVLTPYQDVRGTWTIGYGFTYLNGAPVTASTPPMTKAQADAQLTIQLQSRADAVNRLVKVNLNQNQFDSCISLTYNIGVGAFTNSTVCRMLNANNFPAAADAFLLWNKAGGVVNQTLVARRAKERALFLTVV